MSQTIKQMGVDFGEPELAATLVKLNVSAEEALPIFEIRKQSQIETRNKRMRQVAKRELEGPSMADIARKKYGLPPAPKAGASMADLMRDNLTMQQHQHPRRR